MKDEAGCGWVVEESRPHLAGSLMRWVTLILRAVRLVRCVLEAAIRLVKRWSGAGDFDVVQSAI